MKNKLKNKRMYLFALVISMLVVSLAFPTTLVRSDLKVGTLPLTHVTLSVEGDPDTSPSMSSFQSVPYRQDIGLELDLNGTLNAEGMALDSFADVDLSSELFQTDGITRTYSDSYASRITGISTGVGMYQTLRTIPESSFSQYAILKDSTVYSFTLPEPLSKLVNDTINDAYPTLTYLNVTINELYLTYVFDRTIIDAFFAAAKTSDLFEEVSETYSTNKQLITSMMDPIFATTGFNDIVYAPVNVSTYASDWSLVKENRAVLGLNASDTSFDNATKTCSLRNLMIGYIGWKIAPTTTVNAGLEAIDKSDLAGDVIYGFEQTATTYSLKMNILPDFTGSGLVWNYSLIIDVFGLADEVGPALASTYYWFMVIGIGTGVFLAVIVASLIFSKNRDKIKQHAVWGILLGLITSVIVFIATTVTKVVT